MQLICITPVPGLSSVKVLAQSVVQYLSLHWMKTRRREEEEDETHMPPHMNHKTPLGVSKIYVYSKN